MNDEQLDEIIKEIFAFLEAKNKTDADEERKFARLSIMYFLFKCCENVKTFKETNNILDKQRIKRLNYEQRGNKQDLY